MTKPLADSIALITGASRGIGACLALELARAGAHVVAIARTQGGLEELDDRIKSVGGTATLVPLDLKDNDGIARLALALDERYGKLDVLVGNAGMLGPLSPLGHVEPKNWNDTLAINVTANWQLIRCMDPLLRRAPAGRAVFVSSVLAWAARAYCGPYSASKAALNALALTYAEETAATNVRVNLFNPGRTDTRMFKSGWPGVDPATLNRPEAVAAAALRLCLPEFTETGKIVDFTSPEPKSFHPPS